MISQNCTKYSDEKLVKLTLANNDYFFCLMDRYEAKLLRYIHRISSLPYYDADDILQDSYIAAFKNLNDFDPSYKFSSWIYRIVHNQTINFLKKHHRHLSISLDPDNEEFIGWLDEKSDNIDLPLDQLKPIYKEILVLKFFEEFNYKEIAAILHFPIGTVATLIRRAKLQFKQIYEKSKPKNS